MINMDYSRTDNITPIEQNFSKKMMFNPKKEVTGTKNWSGEE